MRQGVLVPPFDEELLERRGGSDHLRRQLAELASASDRSLEELGVASTVERALPSGAAATAVVPTHDVDDGPVAAPRPLDAHPVVNVVARRTRYEPRGSA